MSYQYYEQDFGELVLVIGDLHIPNRATQIPSAFQDLLVPNKVQRVICTGNIGNKDSTELLRSLSNNLQLVKGDQDESDAEESKVFNVGGFKIGLVHGHQVIPWNDEQSLYTLSLEWDVDILIYGHSHQQKVSQFQDKWFINPGSVTGAYNGMVDIEDITPSFILLEFKETQVTVYFYSIKNGELDIQKKEINK